MECLFVANRGEIARRIIKAAHGLGIEAVGVFADDDAKSLHVKEADRAVRVSLGYMDPTALIEAAKKMGADALHPGYGFLSEDPRLARACNAAGITWVGPPASVMELMANKVNAKKAAQKAGVFVLETWLPTDKALLDPNNYPVLIKASKGGGGRGMRLVEDPRDMRDALLAAEREALATFSTGEIFAERYLEGARHIEVQILADNDGHVIHLFDRECSIQRRHQKVIEEAPAINIDDFLREQMWEGATKIASGVGYVGAGTIEYVECGGEVSFLEMNTRLQVEHGISELLTGLDIVQIQLEIASGKPLGISQGEVQVHGHAIEARLCAEVPEQGHRPAPGNVVHVRWPTKDCVDVRVDAGVESMSSITANYDSLIAKIMTKGKDRMGAIATMRHALGASLEIDGISTNRAMLSAIFSDPDFQDGKTPTNYLTSHPQVIESSPPPFEDLLAASLVLDHIRSRRSVVPGSLGAWRNVGSPVHRDHFDTRLSIGIKQISESVFDADGTIVIGRVDDTRKMRQNHVSVEIDGVVSNFYVRLHGDLVSVSAARHQSTLRLIEEESNDFAKAGGGEHRVSLPGRVVMIHVKEGDLVHSNDPLVVIEAMKMEHTIRAGLDGSVSKVGCKVDQQVDTGDLLVVIEPSSTEASGPEGVDS